MQSRLAQVSDIEIRLLRVFRAVTECGGFAAAELELNIGRSTISRHIKDLEIRLGMTLCRRGRSGFSLTDEGREIYDATLRLLASLDAFRGQVNEVQQRMTGNLTLALFDKTVSNPACRIHQAIRRFDHQAPDVHLEFYVDSLNEIERGVMDGRFNIGVVPFHRRSSSLTYGPLFDEQMYLYCSEEHPLFARDDGRIRDREIAGCKYAGLGYHSPNMEVGQHQGLRREATAYDQEAIASLILSGRYLGYLPDHYAEPFVRLGRIRAIRKRRFQYRCQFQSIVRRAPKPSRIVAAFLDCLDQAHAER